MRDLAYYNGGENPRQAWSRKKENIVVEAFEVKVRKNYSPTLSTAVNKAIVDNMITSLMTKDRKRSFYQKKK